MSTIIVFFFARTAYLFLIISFKNADYLHLHILIFLYGKDYLSAKLNGHKFF